MGATLLIAGRFLGKIILRALNMSCRICVSAILEA